MKKLIYTLGGTTKDGYSDMTVIVVNKRTSLVEELKKYHHITVKNLTLVDTLPDIDYTINGVVIGKEPIMTHEGLMITKIETGGFFLEADGFSIISPTIEYKPFNNN
jgi:hypothetical protein